MRKSVLYLWSTAAGMGFLIALLAIHPAVTRETANRRINLQRQLTSRLGLTDICLFTEAAYLRHPNLADRFTPFQNHPLALSHFPSEGFVLPPEHIRPVDDDAGTGAMP